MYYEFLAKEFGISRRITSLGKEAEASLDFGEVKRVSGINQLRVLKAFGDCGMSDFRLSPSTGYGYGDVGRDTLEQIFAAAFGCEGALVRHNIVSGTHAIATALFGLLRPGDVLLSASGRPYDTLLPVIGAKRGDGSLRDFGVSYREVPLVSGRPDEAGVLAALEKDSRVKVCLIQRSKGYDWRESLGAGEISALYRKIKALRPDVWVLVDNCYGEFVEDSEPLADVLVGSLIKNPGGGVAKSGGYIAGAAECLSRIEGRLTAPGLGRECGASLGHTRDMALGFFLSPHVVGQAVKAAMLCAAVFEGLGFLTLPRADAPRRDIVQAVRLGSAEKVVEFCRGVQAGSPVDANAAPEPWDMPGYAEKVVMASGAFVQGSSIEMSADGPIRPPFAVYFQGSLTFEAARAGIMLAAERVSRLL